MELLCSSKRREVNLRLWNRLFSSNLRRPRSQVFLLFALRRRRYRLALSLLKWVFSVHLDTPHKTNDVSSNKRQGLSSSQTRAHLRYNRMTSFNSKTHVFHRGADLLYVRIVGRGSSRGGCTCSSNRQLVCGILCRIECNECSTVAGSVHCRRAVHSL